MAKKKQATALSSESVAALRACSFDGNTFKLPDGHLDCYAEIKSLMAVIGGKWQGKRKRMEFGPGVDCETLVMAACDRGEIPPSNPMDFFPTPPDVIRDVLALSWFSERWDTKFIVCEDRPIRYCEPNGGSGALVAVMAARLRPCDELVVVEMNPLLAAMLRKNFPQVTVIEGDFLDYQDEKPFDVIFMNPPFDGKTYQKHVLHAISMLGRFGILAAIVPSGFINHGDEFLYTVLRSGEWHDLGGDRFEGATVTTSVMFFENDPRIDWREETTNGYSSNHAWNASMAIASDGDMLKQLRRADDFDEALRVLKGWTSAMIQSGSCARMDAKIGREVLVSLSHDYNMEGIAHLVGMKDKPDEWTQNEPSAVAVTNAESASEESPSFSPVVACPDRAQTAVRQGELALF